ncbi:AAA family ATPase [Catenulispora yoronensis]
MAIPLAVDDTLDDGPPEPGALNPLDEALEHAENLARILGEFEYAAETVTGHETLGSTMREVAEGGSDDVHIVHVVAHGTVVDTGELRLHQTDGKPMRESVDTWTKQFDDGLPHPHVLFLLDVCHAGAGSAWQWAHRIRAEKRRAWILAASGSRDKAYDYRLTRAVVEVLHRYDTKELRVDPSVRYLPYTTFAGEVGRVMRELGENSLPQEPDGTPLLAHERDVVDQLPFFPNPRWMGTVSGLDQVDEAARPFADTTLDREHFAGRASGTQVVGVESGHGHFQGRAAQLRALSQWMDSQEAAGGDDALRVVTGKPGVGKSALLGALVCAAHPLLRKPYERLWWHLPAMPSKNERLVAVHARQLGTDEVAAAIARQMSAAAHTLSGGDESVGEGATGNVVWTAESLLDLARSRGVAAPVTIVIDAVDEAGDPTSLVTTLLLRLLPQPGSAGPWPIRLLAGTRRGGASALLLGHAAGTEGGLIDLDAIDPAQLRRELADYIKALLQEDEWYDNAANVGAAVAFAHHAAARLTEKPRDWGEFLAAGLITRHRLDSPHISDPERGRALGERVPCTLDRLLDMELSRPEHPRSVGPVLTALAFALGRGMPERVLQHVAAVFSPGRNGPLPIAEVREGLEAGRFYLRREVERDGTTLYRLFHERLAEELRALPRGPEDLWTTSRRPPRRR